MGNSSSRPGDDEKVTVIHYHNGDRYEGMHLSLTQQAKLNSICGMATAGSFALIKRSGTTTSTRGSSSTT